MKFFKIFSTVALVATVASIAADYNYNNDTNNSMMDTTYETNTWNKKSHKPYGTMNKPYKHMYNNKNMSNSMVDDTVDYDTDYDLDELNENVLD